jgi:hypothetical protein
MSRALLSEVGTGSRDENTSKQEAGAPFGSNRNGKGSGDAGELRRPVAFCGFCSTRTPHLYERLAVNGRLTSRAVCLACNNERSREPAD